MGTVFSKGEQQICGSSLNYEMARAAAGDSCRAHAILGACSRINRTTDTVQVNDRCISLSSEQRWDSELSISL